MLKSVIKLINNNKNKLNNEIILNFHPYPNAYSKSMLLKGLLVLEVVGGEYGYDDQAPSYQHK